MTPSVELSEEQKAIVFASELQISVVASAGAGKTRVLVERYLKHVLDEGTSPDGILTITFTRKAAAEMKERIVLGLRNAGAFDEAQIAETGPIQTIHALCEQLLRENAVDARIDAKFEILSEGGSNRLQIEAIEEALSCVDTENEDAEDLIGALAGKGTYNRSDSPYARLRFAILETLRQLRGSGRSAQEAQEIYRDSTSFRELWTDSLVRSQPEEIQIRYLNGTDSDWRENLKLAWKTSSKPTPSWMRHLPDTLDDQRSESQTCGVVQFALEAWTLLESKMEQLQTFDFTYLEDRTLTMFEHSPEVQANLAKKFAIVMVDEAQDLNPKQYALLEILGRGRKLTVGDGRQSIYGFRLADPKLFLASISDNARRLTRNYRSVKGILNFIDRVFLSIWKESYEPMAEAKPFDLDSVTDEDFEGVELWEMPNHDQTGCANYVLNLIEEGNDPGHICILTRNGATCQTIHEALNELGIESRIHGGSEKFYTRMEVRDLANILHVLADPYNDFSLLATLRGPAVELSLEGVVRLGLKLPVIDSLGEVALSGDDQEKMIRFLSWFEPLRGYADRLSAWEVLSRVFVESPFLDALSRRDSSRRQLANVRKLLVLATQDSHLGPLEFAEQIRDIQQIRHKEGDAEEFRDQSNVVRLMTIHKAKGLEFPIVVLPETNKKLGQGTSEIVYDPELKLLGVHFGGPQGLFHKFLSERKKNREVAEELRILYVAVTRAQRKLCICLFPPSSGDTISRRIREAVGAPAPASIRIRTLASK